MLCCYRKKKKNKTVKETETHENQNLELSPLKGSNYSEESKKKEEIIIEQYGKNVAEGGRDKVRMTIVIDRKDLFT